jgi:putative transposase
VFLKSATIFAEHNANTMNARHSRYKRHRFPPEIISYAVWLYHRFSLSFRDIEDLLAQRGVIVSYESIRRWCLKVRTSFSTIAQKA